jgi:DEAD/DEAH box helicase domain-containing protein
VLDTLIEAWLSDPSIVENIVSRKHDPPSSRNGVAFPEWLHPSLGNALRENGITALYPHQSEALHAIQLGRHHTLIVSGIASGKSLIYQIPILNTLLESRDTSALLLFPTKALAYDQGTKLQNIISKLPELRSMPSSLMAQFDGDTPSNQRSKIIQNAQILLTNPDMLHHRILPRHSQWNRFFSNLKYIVLDEIHVYRGVFGSHVANILRRLKRIAAHYRSRPQFILTSGTISAPEEFAAQLIEEPLVKIEQKATTNSERSYWIYNPPILNTDLGIRRHPFIDAQRFTLDSIAHHLHSIIFCRSRKEVELLLIDLREKSVVSLSDGEQSIRSYRSGYLPSLRRDVEQSLRSGNAKCVVATNALELGIDIGALDITMIIGFPGSIASTWQQFGRSGRTGRASLGILLLSDDPLDQYLAQHPSYLWESTPEKVIIDPNNPLILLAHLRCALYELPISEESVFGTAPTDLLSALLESLVLQGDAIRGTKAFYFSDTKMPHSFSIRSISENSVQLILDSSHSTSPLGTVDFASADWLIHPGATYFHDGHPYEVETLDLNRHVAILKPGSLDRITQPLIDSQVQSLVSTESEHFRSPSGYSYQIAYGHIELWRQVQGYLVFDRQTRLVRERNSISLPPRALTTKAFWLTLSQALVESLRRAGTWSNDPNQYGSNWQVQKNLARQRDHYRCQSCGLPEKGQAHHVHHKIPFRLFANSEEANCLENLITLCPACHRKVEGMVRVQSGLAALGYTFTHISPLFARCDRQDLGVIIDPQPRWNENLPTILIHEQFPGGIGLAFRLYQIANQLLQTLKDHIQRCPCADGCPSCTGPVATNGMGGKKEALALLEKIAA